MTLKVSQATLEGPRVAWCMRSEEAFPGPMDGTYLATLVGALGIYKLLKAPKRRVTKIIYG